MVHIIFDTNSVKIDDFIQTGNGLSYFEGVEPYQRGRGYFVGISRQRGGGVGDIFRSLWRLLLPALRNTGQIVKNEGIATGARIFNNLNEGANISETLKNETKTGVQNLIEKIQKGGGGKKRKRNLIGRTVIPSIPQNSINRSKKKRKDTFGLY